jgi:small subunit ribosomal protein S20
MDCLGADLFSIWTNPHLSCKIQPCNCLNYFGGSTLANIKSQIKRNRQNENRRVRNRVVRGRARTFVAKARAAIQSENTEDTKAAVAAAISALDNAAQKGVIHKNNAARRKSRLMKRLAALSE